MPVIAPALAVRRRPVVKAVIITVETQAGIGEKLLIDFMLEFVAGGGVDGVGFARAAAMSNRFFTERLCVMDEVMTQTVMNFQ